MISALPWVNVCAFCHTPHGANDPNIVPLWNRNIQNLGAYTVYGSSTMNTTPATPPSGASLACLSCHDQAPGGAASNTHRLRNAPGSGGLNAAYVGSCTMCHQGGGGSYYNPEIMVGPNLTDDHPISMTYPTNAQDPAFHAPPDLMKGWSDIKLYNGKIECASCHNPHDPTVIPFLRKTNTQSAMCKTCHIK